MSDPQATAAACDAARSRLPLLHLLSHDAIGDLLQSQGADGVLAVLSQVSEATGLEVNGEGSVVAVSANEESLPLEPPVPAEGRESIAVLEDLLKAVPSALKFAVQNASKAGDLTLHLQQAASVVLSAAFSSSVSAALASANPAAALADLRKKQEQAAVRAVRGLHLAGQTELLQRRHRNILFLALHHAYILDELRAAHGPNAAWAGMLQTELAADGSVTLRVGGAVVPYGWQFHSTDRLVPTPDADRAGRSILAGRVGGTVHLTGPVGSGKTETARQVAHDLGLRAVVVNCSDDADGTVHQNACKAGSGGGVMVIFDEFNRSEKESAAKFLASRAASSGSSSGPWVVCSWNPGLQGKGPSVEELHGAPLVALSSPDLRLLLRGLLANLGFERYESAAAQLWSLFSWAKEHLSRDAFYDAQWGLRSFLDVIRPAGTALKGNVTEAAALRHALDLSVTSRLTAADRAKWTAEVDRVMGAPGSPARQFAGLAKHKFGLVALAAKSETALEGVRRAAEEEGVALVHVDMATAKDCLNATLYGAFDSATNAFVDGAVSRALKEGNGKAWVVVGGEGLSPQEVQELTDVLDGIKLLFFETGDKVPLGHQLNLVFLNLDAGKHSPGAILRLGVVRF